MVETKAARHSLPESHRLHLILMVGVLLLAFWLRVERLAEFPPGISNDEAVNVVDAFHVIRTGNFPLYEDQGRPEPLFRLIQAGGAALFGTSVWAFRLTSVFVGMFTVAAGYWAAREAFRDIQVPVRRVACLAVAIALAVAIGHVTLSRTTYRAIPQPLLTFIFVGFLLRGLRTGQIRDVVISALSLAAALYSYTAALVLPAALFPFGLSLLIFRRRTWRIWFPRLLLLGLVFAILMIPVGLLLINSPQAVLGRASALSESQRSLERRIQIFVAEFFVRGDENPQYNVASAPLLPPNFMALFVFGLVALVIRLRQPSSALIAALLILSAIPVIASNEITHGLRIIGEFATFPLIIGAGVVSALTLLHYVALSTRTKHAIHLAAPVILALFALADGLYARQTYADYWVTPIPWYIYDRELQHAEWFFRPDRRDFARWLTAQDQPLLVPIDELNKVTTRAWLISAYPEVITAGDDYQPPAGTRLVAPWSLELGDLYRDTRHYAVLDDGKIILMPPLSVAAHTDLLAGIDAAQALTRETGSIDLLARTVPLSESAELVFEAITLTASQEAGLARFGNDEVVLLDWRGPNTVDTTGERILAYTLDWTPATERIGHEYNTFLQIQTQDHEWITGDDAGILRWLFPSSIWQRDDVISDVHVLALPDILEPGAYRLVTGMYIQVNRPVPAYSTVGSVVNNGATIGWIKVPQSGTPVAGEEAISIDANLADTFNLHSAAVRAMGDETVRIQLYWESTIERPEIDATIFVHILNAEGALVAQSDIRPWNGQYPTFIWSRGEMVQTDHVLSIGDTELAGLQVSVGMYTFPDIVPLKVIQNGQESDEGRVVLGHLDELLRSGTNEAD